MVVEDLKSRLNFESEEKIDELREKLKSRDALGEYLIKNLCKINDLKIKFSVERCALFTFRVLECRI